MPLHSMELSTADAAHFERALAKPEAPKYPSGLTLYLEEETIAKLKLEALPKAGKEMVLHAKVVVTNSGVNESEDGARRSLTLQITAMGLGSGEVKEQSAAEALFDKDGGPGSIREKPGTVIMEDM